MKQYQEIEILLERFMEGRTSLGEEARLSEFFRQTPDLPSEWEPYRECLHISTVVCPTWKRLPLGLCPSGIAAGRL